MVYKHSQVTSMLSGSNDRYHILTALEVTALLPVSTLPETRLTSLHKTHCEDGRQL